MNNAVVTGGTRGIGLAISDKLKDDYPFLNVHSYDRSSGDLSTDSGIEELISKIPKNKIKVLINNAAFTKFIPHTDLDSLDDETYDKIFQVNVKAPFKLIRGLKDRFTKDACIINIASVAGITGNGSNIAYCASKGALITMTKSFARSLAPIRVNSISPGLIKTDFVKFDDDYYDSMADMTPIPRIGQPKDVANVVSSIIHSDYITGQNIVVDGGRTLN
jgi:3-oxoacyl-[acyl-carrier protein] reductase